MASDSKPAQRSTAGDPPRFMKALVADARLAAAYRGERHEFRSRLDGVVQALRLAVQADAFLALVAYRIEARLRALGVPVLPWIARRMAILLGQISIAPAATVHPGVFIPNGQVVVEGSVEIQPGAALFPGVTVGPIGGEEVGPTIGFFSRIGAGAKVMGEIQVGANSRVGANAVVLDDVPPKTTVVGIPARSIAD